jgi:hypothetical protein
VTGSFGKNLMRNETSTLWGMRVGCNVPDKAAGGGGEETGCLESCSQVSPRERRIWNEDVAASANNVARIQAGNVK